MGESVQPVRIGTGVSGLDDILGGGLPSNRLYLIQGDPGTGKTTLSLQFLLEGRQRGERGLFITLSETADELRAVAASHGWNLDGIDLFELSAAQQNRTSERNTLFHPSEVELQEVTQVLLEEIERLKPTRVVLDSLSELRLLAQSPLRFRRQILALKQHFVGQRCTVLLLDDRGPEDSEAQAHTVVHGVMEMEQLAPDYGTSRRRLRVVKLRGVQFRGGYHDYLIIRGGLTVFPRLIAAEHGSDFIAELLSTGIPELDALMGGGIDRGTSLLILGPAGSGKTSLGMQFVTSAAQRGEHSVMFLFDERVATMMARAAGIGLDIRGAIKQGHVTVRQIDPAELGPGEFVQLVRDEVENRSARVVLIDTLNGYLNAMPEEKFLTVHMHELLSYLGHHGVITISVMAQHGFIGRMETPLDVSYISDSVLMLRFFEADGKIHQAVSMVKRRTGRHERTIREFQITSKGLRVGTPLTDFHGILTGVPNYTGKAGPLLNEQGKLQDGTHA